MPPYKLKLVLSSFLSFLILFLGLTTVNAAPIPALDLKTASTFSAIGLTVSNTGSNTSMSGDFGITNGAPTGSAFLISGANHAVDAQASQAMLDIQSAYDDAISRASTFDLAGDLAGRTLLPGVYSSGGAAISQSTTLTFDAEGNSNAVFIIKIGGAFSAAATSNMVLVNGAQAKNIFWVVAGAVGLATGTHAVGTIISIGALSLGDGATINGRTLSAAALNLYDNVLTGVVSAAAAAAQAVIDAANAQALIDAAAAQAVIDAAAAQAVIDAANAAAARALANAANAQALIDAANAAAARALANAANAAAAEKAASVLDSPLDVVTKIISNSDGGVISVFLKDELGELSPITISIPSNVANEELQFSITSPILVSEMKAGFTTIKITAKNSANVAVIQFSEPLQINLGKVNPELIIASSSDGYLWNIIEKLNGVLLNINDQDGYYLNNNGEVIILTRHLTSFGTKIKRQNLEISTSERTLTFGEDFQLGITEVAGNGFVSFNSLTSDVCSVTSSGSVSSHSPGDCYLTASLTASGYYLDVKSAPKLFVIESAIRIPQLEVTKIGTIYFTRSTSALDHKAYLALAKVLNNLKKYEKFTLKVTGFSDITLGLDNSVLSQNRAKSVAAYLRKNLVTSKISVSGAGASQTVAIARTADQLNRRVEVWVTSTK